MMARNHILGGTAMLVGGVSLAYAGASWADEWLGSISPGWLGQAGDAVEGWLRSSLWLGLPLFWLGCLLPDIDSKSSKLGRLVHVPGPHRGLTHTNWVLLLLGVGAWFDPTGVVWWLLLGVVTHLVIDGWSKAGRVGFYPLGRYKIITFADGTPCVVTAKYRQGLYKSGKPSELIVLGCLLAVTVGLAALAVFTHQQLG